MPYDPKLPASLPRTGRPATVAEVENRLATSLKPCVASCVLKDEHFEYPERGDARVVTVYRIAGLPVAADSSAVRDAVEAFREANRPARHNFLVMEVGRLRAVTEHRQAAQAALDMLVAVMVDELQGYPEDVLAEVLRGWPRKCRWWPALKDILDECNALVAKRRAMLRCLEDMSARLEEAGNDRVGDVVVELGKAIRADR